MRFPFWSAVEGLVEQHQPFDVVVLPEGTLREDWLTAEDLARYRTVVLPECTVLTPAQADAIRGYLEHGGRVLATGELGEIFEPSVRATLLSHPHLVRTTDVLAKDFAGGPQVFIEPGVDLAVNIHRVGDKEAAISDPLRLRRGARRGAGDRPDDPRCQGGAPVPERLRAQPDRRGELAIDVQPRASRDAPDRARERLPVHGDPSPVMR